MHVRRESSARRPAEESRRMAFREVDRGGKLDKGHRRSAEVLVEKPRRAMQPRILMGIRRLVSATEGLTPRIQETRNIVPPRCRSERRCRPSHERGRDICTARRRERPRGLTEHATQQVPDDDALDHTWVDGKLVCERSDSIDDARGRQVATFARARLPAIDRVGDSTLGAMVL